MAEAKVTLEMEPASVDEDLIIPPLDAAPKPPPISEIDIVPNRGKRPLIINIETTGLDPLQDRIISIGFTDPFDQQSPSAIIMETDESLILSHFFQFYSNNNFNELVGYGLGFDIRFILIKAMYHDVSCKSFFEADLLDLMEICAKGRQEYVYLAQKALKLSELADYLFNYPKPFTDQEMIAFYKSGNENKVLEFAHSQIHRILLLYYQYSHSYLKNFSADIPSSPAGALASNYATPDAGSFAGAMTGTLQPSSSFVKCVNCLAEYSSTEMPPGSRCPICGQELQLKGG